jgi:hypothetical protein
MRFVTAMIDGENYDTIFIEIYPFFELIVLSLIRLHISNICIDPVLSKQKDALINT